MIRRPVQKDYPRAITYLDELLGTLIFGLLSLSILEQSQALADLVAILLGVIVVLGETIFVLLGPVALLLDAFLHLTKIMLSGGPLNLESHESMVGFLNLNANLRCIINRLPDGVVYLLGLRGEGLADGLSQLGGNARSTTNLLRQCHEIRLELPGRLPDRLSGAISMLLQALGAGGGDLHARWRCQSGGGHEEDRGEGP